MISFLVAAGALGAVLLLAAASLLLYAVLKAAHVRPGTGNGHRPGALDRAVLAVLTRAIRAALRVGVRLGPMVMLTVRGRTTGLPRSNPVDLWRHGPNDYLVATHDDTAAWVRNLRAAGEGSFRLGRGQWHFAAAELPQQEAGEILQTLLAPRMRRPVAGFVLRQTLAVAPDAPTADFVTAAAQHPVFQLTVTGGPDRPASAPNTDRLPMTTETRRLPAALILLGIAVALTHFSLGLAHVLDTTGWISGVILGLLMAGIGNHLRIFGPPAAHGRTGTVGPPPPTDGVDIP